MKSCRPITARSDVASATQAWRHRLGTQAWQRTLKTQANPPTSLLLLLSLESSFIAAVHVRSVLESSHYSKLSTHVAPPNSDSQIGNQPTNPPPTTHAADRARRKRRHAPRAQSSFEDPTRARVHQHRSIPESGHEDPTRARDKSTTLRPALRPTLRPAPRAPPRATPRALRPTLRPAPRAPPTLCLCAVHNDFESQARARRPPTTIRRPRPLADWTGKASGAITESIRLSLEIDGRRFSRQEFLVAPCAYGIFIGQDL